jgi:hypothetical protein
MKIKIIIVLVLLFCAFLTAANEKATNDSKSLIQISSITYTQVFKLMEYLELDRSVNLQVPLSGLGRNNEDLQKALQLYQKNLISFYFGVALVGLFTVFSGLLLISLVIYQLRHLDKKKKVRPSKLPESNFTGMEISESDAITAAITATIYLHELEVEENNKLLLTWKRNTLSMWKVAGYIPMNETDPSRRKL